jgi:hypothetical protein
MTVLQFAGRYQCLPIRCSGRLISLQNERPKERLKDWLLRDQEIYAMFAYGVSTAVNYSITDESIMNMLT